MSQVPEIMTIESRVHIVNGAGVVSYRVLDLDCYVCDVIYCDSSRLRPLPLLCT